VAWLAAAAGRSWPPVPWPAEPGAAVASIGPAGSAFQPPGLPSCSGVGGSTANTTVQMVLMGLGWPLLLALIPAAISSLFDRRLPPLCRPDLQRLLHDCRQARGRWLGRGMTNLRPGGVRPQAWPVWRCCSCPWPAHGLGLRPAFTLFPHCPTAGHPVCRWRGGPADFTGQAVQVLIPPAAAHELRSVSCSPHCYCAHRQPAA